MSNVDMGDKPKGDEPTMVPSDLTSPELLKLLQERKIPTRNSMATRDWRKFLVKILEKRKNQIAVTDSAVSCSPSPQEVEQSDFLITLRDHRNKRTVLLQGWVLK